MPTHIKVVLLGIHEEKKALFSAQFPRIIVGEILWFTSWKITEINHYPDPKKVLEDLKGGKVYIPDQWANSDPEVQNPVLMRAFWEQHIAKSIEMFDVFLKHGVSLETAIQVVEPYRISQYFITVESLDKFPLKQQLEDMEKETKIPVILELFKAMQRAYNKGVCNG